MGRPEILVVGAGVSGLTTAVHLAESGYGVRLIAERPPERTTSSNAGASWGPYLMSDDRAMEWGESTRLALEEIAKDDSSGVRLLYGREVSEEDAEPPSWARRVADYAPCTEPLPPGSLCGWHYRIPVIHMPAYLGYLIGRLRAAGVEPAYGRALTSFDELRGAADVVVNCTGLGSRELLRDGRIHPVYGLLVVVENPGLDEFYQDNPAVGGDLTYILPHRDEVVLGGYATRAGISLEDRGEIARRIVDRCAAIEPALRDAPQIGLRFGARPTRDQIRVESVRSDGQWVIHNYGHGASGVSMSWGCAQEVGRMVG